MIVVAHRGNRKNSRKKITVLRGYKLDEVIDSGKRKPVIPKTDEILSIGVGEIFIDKYKNKYNCKTVKELGI